MHLLWTVVAAALLQGGASPTDGAFHTLAVRSLAISSDGRSIAFARRLPSELKGVELWVRDLIRGTQHRLLSRVYPGYSLPSPAWSADGRFLAYFGWSAGALQLRVWDRERGRELYRSREAATATPYAHAQVPQWTPDSRFVLFIADSGVTTRVSLSNAPSLDRLWAELVGITPAPNGITELRSPSLKPHASNPSGSAPSAPNGGVVSDPRRIVALDVRTGATRTVAKGTDLMVLQTATDGTRALLVTRSPRSGPTVYADGMDLYLVPLSLDCGPARERRTVVPSGGGPSRPVDACGVPLRQLAARVPTDQYQNVSFARSGRYVAYISSATSYGPGPRTTGDVLIADIERDTTVNLTTKVEHPPYAEGEPDGKFGTTFTAPFWNADESALFVVGVVRRKSATVPNRSDLWRVSRIGGGVRRLVDDTTLSLEALAVCQESRQPCVTGPNGSIVAKVRLLHEDSLAYAAIDPETGVVRILQRLGMGPAFDGRPYEVHTAYAEFVSARATGDLVSLEESPDRPPELWFARTSGTPAAHRLNVLNPGPVPPHGTVQRLHWITPAGDSLFAALYLPAGVTSAERPPVIVVVYPGHGGLGQELQFDGGDPKGYAPLKNRGRYALVVPDLPRSGADSGRVCDRFADNALAALDAAIATGRVDGTRAGLIGISFGGYVVNCIVTRTNRFRAAVSEVGLSDIESAYNNVGPKGLFRLITGAAPWEAPERYVKESPVFYLDKVETPLLLIAGKKDQESLTQQMEMYFGLLELGRPVALVAYDKGDHGDYRSFPDFWPRVLDWFDEHFNQRTPSTSSAAHHQ